MTLDLRLLDDPARLREVRDLGLVGAPRDERFDRVTRTAQRLLDVPFAFLNLVGDDAVWVTSCVGLDVQQVDRDVAFCSTAIASEHALLVPDTTRDDRFATNPVVVAGPGIRSYAGRPLRGPGGLVVGTLCVMDVRPRAWSAADAAALDDLAHWAESTLAADDVQRRLAAGEAVDRLKDEFVSVVSHELRTPLTSLRGSLGMLAAGVLGPLSAPGQQMADVAVSSTERLVRLVDDILDLERLVAGQVVLQRREHALSALARTAADAVGGLADSAEVVLQLDVDEGSAWFDGDRLVQVLVNLLGNAVKFSPRGAAVQLRARREESAVVLEVADAGRGIPPEQLQRVFDRFAQVDASDSRDRGGSGLGLAIARNVVEAHGGTISARSTVGAGSTFTVVLPQRRSAVAPRPGGRRADDTEPTP